MVDLKEIKMRNDLELKELEGGLFGGTIRIVPLDDGDMLFCARDCALILEYKRTERAIQQHVLKDAKVKLNICNFQPPQNGGVENNARMISTYGAIFITEQGLYDLISGSKMPKAVEFRKWVGEVLSTFRKTGKYDRTDFAKSKHSKTIKSLPGYSEDPAFKEYCTIQARDIAKMNGELIGKVWNKVTNIIFEHFGINILREITKFTKKNNLSKRPNVREFLDLAGYHMQTYIAFEILRHDDNLKTNPERLAYIVAMCQKYFSKLNPYERYEIKNIIVNMFNNGILTPGADYEAVSSYNEVEAGVKSIIVFKE